MDELDLLDWKRRVSELYADVRAASDPVAGWHRWCETRRELFRARPQSPVPADVRSSFGGPFVYDYDPRWRLLDEVKQTDGQRLELPSSDGGTMTFRRFAQAHADGVVLDLYWLEGYGGGLFVPFADATSGHETYGAGRYVHDTVKGSDLSRRVLTTIDGPARWRRPRTGWTCVSRPASAGHRLPMTNQNVTLKNGAQMPVLGFVEVTEDDLREIEEAELEAEGARYSESNQRMIDR